MRPLLTFLADDTGATAVEYGVMLSLIVVTLMGTISAVGEHAYSFLDTLIQGMSGGGDSQ
jgi:Flp pilus assembly pilin Flp